MAESTYLTILSMLAVGLLIAVTGGVAYLTTMEWRDRRRIERENREKRGR
jgi:hypothetical protein